MWWLSMSNLLHRCCGLSSGLDHVKAFAEGSKYVHRLLDALLLQGDCVANKVANLLRLTSAGEREERGER